MFIQALAEQSEEEPEINAGGKAVVTDSVKAACPFELETQLEVGTGHKTMRCYVLNSIFQTTAFWNEVDLRRRYLRSTIIHPSASIVFVVSLIPPLTTSSVKTSELEALSEAVKAEVQRTHAHRTHQL